MSYLSIEKFCTNINYHTTLKSELINVISVLVLLIFSLVKFIISYFYPWKQVYLGITLWYSIYLVSYYDLFQN